MKTFAFSAAVVAAMLAGQTWAHAQATAPRNTRQNQQGESQQGQAGQAGQRQTQGQNQQGQPQQGGQRNQAQQAGQAGQSQGNSQQLEQHAAACLLIGNEEEIALSEFGIERAENDQVKEFAREMVKEHTKMVSKVRKFTPQQAADVNLKTEDQPSRSKSGDNQAKSATRSGETTAAKAGSAAAGGSMMEQLVSIEREKAQQCLSINKENLEEHKGADFDKAFMGTQVAAHVSMLAKLRALKGKTSGEFDSLVSEAEKTTQEHLDHAKKVMEEVASSKGSGGARGEQRGNSGGNSDRPAAPAGQRPAPRREG